MANNSEQNISKETKCKKLSQSDRILLSELEDNARCPLSKLAKKLKISQQLLSYRLQVLGKRKILGGYFTRINFPVLGYSKYRILIRFSNFDHQKEKKILDYLMKNKNVQWIVECGGKWDFLINFIAKNVIQFDNFIRDFKNKFPHNIQNFDVFIVIEFLELGRAYFCKSQRELKKLTYFGRDYEQVKVDKIDLLILNYLAEKARITSVEIADKIGVSSNTIRARITNLMAKGVIRDFKPLIHLEYTGFMAYKMSFEFQNYTEKTRKRIIDYLRSDVRVVAIGKLIGQWDFEIEFEVESRQSMLDLIRGFRDEFKEIIKEFELIPLFHEHKYNYFPRDLLE